MLRDLACALGGIGRSLASGTSRITIPLFLYRFSEGAPQGALLGVGSHFGAGAHPALASQAERPHGELIAHAKAHLEAPPLRAALGAPRQLPASFRVGSGKPGPRRGPPQAARKLPPQAAPLAALASGLLRPNSSSDHHEAGKADREAVQGPVRALHASEAAGCGDNCAPSGSSTDASGYSSTW